MHIKNKRKKKFYFKRRKKKSKSNLKFILFLILTLVIILTFVFVYFNTFNKANNKNYKIVLKKEELIDDYLSSKPAKYEREKQMEKNWLELFLSLKNMPDNRNDPLYLELKSKLLNEISENQKKNLSNIETLFITETVNFGNRMVNINNVIYYFEILGVKNIHFNDKHNWYIKDKIVTDKYNISILPMSQVDCKDNKVLCMTLHGGYLFTPVVIFPEIRIHLLKNEILKNLPKININPNDLVIHIRSGIIFKELVLSFYTQPPFCFYQYIISNYKFKNIYIIAENDNNPVINKLISEYPYIIFKRNNIDIDIAFLCNAYNLVGSVSSFLLESIKLNNNLKKYWEYDICRNSHKLFFLHQDFFYFPRKFTYYKMKPSEIYKNEMFAWKKTESQIKLMLEDNCTNTFEVIKPNV